MLWPFRNLGLRGTLGICAEGSLAAQAFYRLTPGSAGTGGPLPPSGPREKPRQGQAGGRVPAKHAPPPGPAPPRPAVLGPADLAPGPEPAAPAALLLRDGAEGAELLQRGVGPRRVPPEGEQESEGR